MTYSNQAAMFERPERYRRIESASKYDHHLSRPDMVRRMSRAAEMAAFKRSIGRVTGQSVLDAPCGTGRLHSILNGKFPEVASLDSSLAMLTVYENKHLQTELFCGDIFNLPFHRGEWDWVVCYRLFHHFKADSDRVHLLKSISRVCRKGVVFSAWLDTPINRRRGSRRSSISRQSLERTIEKSGLELLSLDFAAWPFQPKCVVTCKRPLR